jgi:hypothetical protein
LASRIPIRLLRRRFNFGNQMPPEERWRVCSDSEKWKDKAALANSTTLTGTSVTSWRPSRNGFFVLFLHRLSRPSRVGNKSPIEEVASNSFRCLICATQNINKAIAANSYTISFRVFCLRQQTNIFVPISELNPTAFITTISCGIVDHLPQVKSSQQKCYPRPIWLLVEVELWLSDLSPPVLCAIPAI